MPSLDFSVSPKWSVDEIALKNYTIEQLNRHVVLLECCAQGMLPLSTIK
jgi:hypothetical protein